MLGAVNRVEGDEEHRETKDRNDEHRGNVIDTVIVRIMKYVSQKSQNTDKNANKFAGLARLSSTLSCSARSLANLPHDSSLILG